MKKWKFRKDKRYASKILIIVSKQTISINENYKNKKLKLTNLNLEFWERKIQKRESESCSQNQQVFV